MEQNNFSQDLLARILECILPLLDRQVTVFFTGGGADPEKLLEMIDGMLATEARIVVSDAFMRIAPPGFLEGYGGRLIAEDGAIRASVAASKLAVVPILTRNTLAKAALGIQDNPVTNGIAAALMQGLPVIAIREACHPDSEYSRKMGYNRNPAYNRMLLEHEERLTAFGVKLVDTTEFADTLKNGLYPGLFGKEGKPAPPAAESAGTVRLEGVNLVTCKDLMGFAPGCRVMMDGNAILTPLAQDFAARHRITLTRFQ